MNKKKNIKRASNEFIEKKTNDLLENLENLKREVTTSIEMVTEEIAESWLQKNTMNRRLESGRVNSYKSQLMNDVWQFNGQPIIFATDGTLLDGQGRLTAIFESGVPMACLVVRGVPKSSFSSMDTGKTRTVADVLSASRILGDSNGTIAGYVATIVKKYKEWNASRFGSHGAASTRTTSNNTECLESVQENLEIFVTAAKEAYRLSAGPDRENLMANGKYYGLIIAYLVLDKGWSIEEVVPFIDEMTNKYIQHPKGAATTTIREYLKDVKDGRKKITDEEKFHMFARAWNSYIQKKEVKSFSLKASTEEFMSKEEYQASNAKKIEERKRNYEYAMAMSV